MTVACPARVDAGRVAEARVAVGSVGAVPVRASEAERLLAGLDAAAAEAARAVEDANGSVEYKENLVRVLVQRTFDEVHARAGWRRGAAGELGRQSWMIDSC